MISARKTKQLDATTMFTYSHANTPLGQSERAYYLSYFITSNAAGEFKNSTAPSRRSSSKEAQHRKEIFVRGDSFPDSDVLVNQDQRQITESNQTTRVVGHSYQH